jgi:hypothetical protein
VSAIELPERLEGDGLVLRRLRAEDAAACTRAFREDPELGRLLGFEEDPDEAWARGRIGRTYELVVADPETDAFLGMVLLHSYECGGAASGHSPCGCSSPGRCASWICCASSVLRKRDVERGRRVDVVFYGVLREEWQGD